MRKLYVFMATTLDGYFEGIDHDITWHNVDAEFDEFAISQLKKADTLLFGRKTYELMASYWPTALAKTEDPIIAGFMNSKKKVVFSKTLQKVGWENTKLISEHLGAEIAKLKEEEGQDIAIFGSSKLCTALLELGLIDEIRVMINPILIGDGTPLFKGIKDRIKLTLITTKVFKSGNILLCYEPKR